MPELLEGREVLLLGGPREEEDEFEGYWVGGGPGEPGWYPPEAKEEPEVLEGVWEDVTEEKEGRKSRERERLERRGKEVLRQQEEIAELERREKIEELKARRRGYRRAYRPQVGKTIRTWLKPRPRMELAQIFFPGRALRETYIPRPPVKTTLEQIKEIQKVTKPEMGLESSLGQAVVTRTELLQRAGSPPPPVRIKTPARSPEEFEGLGPTLVRLRRLGEMKGVDQAVLAEVQANGDIDIPSHVRSEVSKLGFTVKEVDTSLKRLRDLGFLVPTGRIHEGEKELMLSGGSHG